MIKRFLNDFIFNDQVAMEGRLFNVITAIGVVGTFVAALVNAFNSTTAVGAVFILILFFMLSGLLIYANKTKKYNYASFVICFGICCILFPVITFTSGGITSGMPSWYILGIFVVFVMLRGWYLVLSLTMCVVVQFFCVVVQYLYPNMMATYVPGSIAQLQDICYSYLVVSIVIGLTMKLQMNVYMKEKKRAEDASQAKADFLANMSHEIRTPINAMVGLNELILRKSTDPEVLEYARQVESASVNLLSIINDVLDFSKIESGNVVLQEHEYSLSDLVKYMESMIVPRAEAKKLSFQNTFDSKLLDHLYGDETRVSQIVLNLLTNAVKYTDQGEVSLQISQTEIEPGTKVYLMFRVMDTGRGIKPEDRDRMFESFQRVDERKNRSIEGTGLGLAITQRLVSLMQGRLEVESTYGKGSIFTVWIPQAVQDNTLFSYIDLKKQLNQRKTKEPSFVAPEARIMVVDDNDVNRQVLVRLLAQTKMQIDQAEGGRTCLSLMEQKKYDMILLDHMMPDLDGIETLHVLRQRKLLQDTAVIVLTANAVSGAREMYLKEGFHDYLSKPVNWEVLERTLMKWLPPAKIKPFLQQERK